MKKKNFYISPEIKISVMELCQLVAASPTPSGAEFDSPNKQNLDDEFWNKHTGV